MMHSLQHEIRRSATHLYGQVSVASPAAVKIIYGSSSYTLSVSQRAHSAAAHGSRYRKSNWYSVWQGRRKFDLFGTRDEKIHGIHRRLVASAYSMTSLKDLEQYVDSAISVFLKQLKQRQSQIVDLGLWVQLLAFGRKSNFPFVSSCSTVFFQRQKTQTLHKE